MARFNARDIDNYGSPSNAGSYFSLKNDRETAEVRFMYEDVDDIEGFSLHKVKVGDKERYVNCLRDNHTPIDACPFCKAGLKLHAKLFVPVYDVNTDSVKIWERGKVFYKKLTSLCDRYSNLVSRTFEIERNGKPGDQKTTYEVYPLDGDDTRLSDLPELPTVLGTIILEKNADDMAYYLEYGEFPDDSTPRRASSRGSEERRTDDEYVRRTPSRNRPSDTF